MDAHDPGWCSSCEYLVGVHAASTDAAYSVVAATAGGIVILEDGVEHQGQVEAGETQSFRLYVPGGGRTAGGKRALRPVGARGPMPLPEAQAAPADPQAHREPRGRSPWPPQPASGRPKVWSGRQPSSVRQA